MDSFFASILYLTSQFLPQIDNNTFQTCEKCHSNKWITNKLGNVTCLNCGFTSSLGYICQDEEIFQDLENPKGLSRYSKFGGELYIKNQYQGESGQQKEEDECHIQLFYECIQFMNLFSQKEIYLQKVAFLNSWEQYLESGQKVNAKEFLFHYFQAQWRDYFALDELELLQKFLKNTLKIKEDKEIKVVNTQNQQTTNESFLELLISVHPQITESQFAICEQRLEEVRYHLNCNKSTLLCVTIYDLMVNNFKLKIDVEKLVQNVHKICQTKGTVLKSSTVKRVYKQLQKSSSTQKSQVYSI